MRPRRTGTEDEFSEVDNREEMLTARFEGQLKVRDSPRRSSGTVRFTEDVSLVSIESEDSFEDFNNSSFLYKALDSSQGFIRLFSLEHGLPVRGSLRQYNLTNCPQYDALSYTWGSKRHTESISVDGQPFKIHRNLFLLFQQLCLRNQQPPIWCDALCINQNALDERNEQVQQMGKVYQKATTVQVWLGAAAEGSNTVLECFERNAHSPDLWYARTFGQAQIEAFWHCFAKLCDREYWKRTWIVQEFLLAQQVQILCGAKSVPWEAFEHVSRKSQDGNIYRSQSAVGRSALDKIQKSTFMSLSQDRKLVSEQRLEELLRKYGSTRCTDIRDRVFGLVGLACDGHMVKVDYTQDVNRLWATIMLSYLPEDPRTFIRHSEKSLGLRSLDPETLERLIIELKEIDTRHFRASSDAVEKLIALRSRAESRRDRRLRSLRTRRSHPMRDLNSLRDSPAREC